jgi:methionyl-tRNA formyltransferase
VKLVYLGTPDAAVPPLRALVDAGHDVVLAVTRADKRRGRGAALVPSPVKAAATELGIPVTTDVEEVIGTGADLGVVVAFGRIIKPHVLVAVPMVNLHFSDLPRWRGAAPVERAILAGDDRTSVCVMDVEEGLDTGGVYAKEDVVIGDDETADELRARLVDIGARLLVDTLATWPAGPPTPQSGEATYADKIRPEDLHLDWSCSAIDLHRVVRVGGAWTTFRGHRLKVHRTRPVTGDGLAPGELDGTRVGTGDGALELVEIQPEGKGRQRAASWRNGARPHPGERLGS